jgi:hypothetical protein
MDSSSSPFGRTLAPGKTAKVSHTWIARLRKPAHHCDVHALKVAVSKSRNFLRLARQRQLLIGASQARLPTVRNSQTFRRRL